VVLLVGDRRDLADRLVQRQVGVFLRRARVDLVVDIGDVAHVGDVIGAIDVPQQAEQHVEHDRRPRIADMGEVVDRRPAHIHAHVRRIERREDALLAGQRIVELQFHRIESRLIQLNSTPGPAGRGVYRSRCFEKRRPQPAMSLANNLPADAADGRLAVHGRHNGRGGHFRQGLDFKVFAPAAHKNSS